MLPHLRASINAGPRKSRGRRPTRGSVDGCGCNWRDPLDKSG